MALLFVLLAPSAAQAKCAAPRPIFSPPPGTALPPKATLWFFVPRSLHDPKLSVKDEQGRALIFSATPLPEQSPPAFLVIEVRVDARAQAERDAAKRIIIEHAVPWQEKRARVEYALGAPEPPRASGVEIVGQGETHHRWTCSHQSTIDLALSVDAPAYRVEWAETAEDWANGRHRSVILPPDLARFFGQAGGSRLQLGYVNCMGATLEWKTPQIWVGVSALMSDGTQTPLARAPARLERPDPSPDPR